MLQFVVVVRVQDNARVAACGGGKGAGECEMGHGKSDGQGTR